MEHQEILQKIVAYEEANLEILVQKLTSGKVSEVNINTSILNTVKAKRYAVLLAIDLTTPDCIREQASISAENALIYSEKVYYNK